MNEDEETTIRAFIVREKRERYLYLLGNKKQRKKMLDCLNHCRDLDPRFCTVVPSAMDVVASLQSKGAPNLCHVISNYHEIDGRTMPLSEAIDIIEYAGWGTLVSCIAGHLAYYYDEEGERRFVLEKK